MTMRKFVAMAGAAVVIAAAPAWAVMPASAAAPASAAPAASGHSAALRHGAAPAWGAFAPGTGQLVVDWNKTTLFIGSVPGAEPATVHPTRALAIVQAAEYDAVVAVTHVGRPYLIRIQVTGRANAAAAAGQAAHDVLSTLFPAEAPIVDTLLATELAALPAGQATQRGIAVGHAVAARLLALRAGDGSAMLPPPFVPGNAPGDYQPTPPAFAAPVFTNWGQVRPFGLRNGAQFRPTPPPAVTSPAYAAALATVESLGRDTSTTRTAEEAVIGKFWGAEPIWNVWNEVAQGQVTARRLSLVRATAVFADLDLTLADTAIGLYDGKYHFQVWRPVTAIRAGVPGVPAVPDWSPLTPTAPDPSYPGAHSGFSFAAATVLTAFFGDQAISIRGRSFEDFRAAATEAALSRIYAGQHTPLDDQAGRLLGSRIADFDLDVLFGGE